MLSKKIGIDFGTANSIIYMQDKGIVLNEPTVVAVSVNANKILAVGLEAKQMLGKTPAGIIAKRPLKNGVIASYKMTEVLLRYFLSKSLGYSKIFRPEVVISIPAGATSVEKRAVYEAVISAGAKKAYLVPEPFLAAIGAGLPIETSFGNMIVNIGGGTTEIAVISLNGIVAWNSERVAGDAFNDGIMTYLRRKYAVSVGEQMAEEIKIQIGAAIPIPEPLEIEIKGRDATTGMPKSMVINSNDLVEAFKPALNLIIQAIKSVLEKTPPELASDIIDRGIVLSGGSSMLRSIDKLLTRAIGVPFHIADDPIFCVAKGTGVAITRFDILEHIVIA